MIEEMKPTKIKKPFVEDSLNQLQTLKTVFRGNG